LIASAKLNVGLSNTVTGWLRQKKPAGVSSPSPGGPATRGGTNSSPVAADGANVSAATGHKEESEEEEKSKTPEENGDTESHRKTLQPIVNTISIVSPSDAPFATEKKRRPATAGPVTVSHMGGSSKSSSKKAADDKDHASSVVVAAATHDATQVEGSAAAENVCPAENLDASVATIHPDDLSPLRSKREEDRAGASGESSNAPPEEKVEIISVVEMENPVHFKVTPNRARASSLELPRGNLRKSEPGDNVKEKEEEATSPSPTNALNATVGGHEMGAGRRRANTDFPPGLDLSSPKDGSEEKPLSQTARTFKRRKPRSDESPDVSPTGSELVTLAVIRTLAFFLHTSQ